MGKLDEFASKLEKIKKDDEKNKINREKTKQEWLKDLHNFVNEVKKWLYPLQSKKLLTIFEGMMTINEEAFGNYSVPYLQLQFSNQTINIKPKARIIIGAKGRIDITSSNIEVMVVKHDDGWKIPIKKENKFDYKNFNEDSFIEILEDSIK